MNQPEMIVGLDIGGANIKAAVWLGDDQVRGASTNFPMWKQPDQLAAAVRALLKQLDASGKLAVTMTGELADCFASRSEGVSRIIDQLLQVVPADKVSVYTVDGNWFTTTQAKQDPWTVAASNWHALATWLARWPTTAYAFQRGVLVDVGSTTVDILPIVGGRLATQARTDRDRLQRSHLIYTGIRRTPICAVLSYLILAGINTPVMAEVFATVDDAYVWLGLTAESAEDKDTADGRPRTKACAAARLARMIGEDAHRLSLDELHSLAIQVIEAQANCVARAIELNLAQIEGNTESDDGTSHLICSGHGLPLFEHAVRKVSMPHRLVRLDAHVSDEVSRCAPAAAVAWLLKHHH